MVLNTKMHKRTPHPSDKPLHYRPDIDGLRAVAVLLVVVFHLFPSTINGGFVGVDVFFVISGFLITGILWKEFEEKKFTQALISFYSRRVKRIFPVLILVFIACYLLALFFMYKDELQQLGKHVAAGAGFIANFAFWSEAGYFDVAAETKPLLHLWSLGIEEQFYLVWPFILYCTWRLRLPARYVAMVLMALSFAFNIYLVEKNLTADFYSPLSRAWELMLGAVLALFKVPATSKNLPDTNPIVSGNTTQPFFARTWVHNVCSVFGFASILLGAFLIDKQSHFPGWFALLPAAGTFLIIAAGPLAWVNRFFLSQKIIVGIGLISYALYLWHWPLFVFAGFIDGQPPSLAHRLIVLVLSLCLATLCYFLVEKPVREKAHTPTKVLVLCCVMLTIGVASYAIYQSRNVETLLSHNIRSYSLVSDEVAHLWRRKHCMLEIGDGIEFTPECTPPADGKPSIMIWGDSVATSFYTGLVTMLDQNLVHVVQYAAGRCPPIIGYVSPFPDWTNFQCNLVNEKVRQNILLVKPTTVIMTAYWRKTQITGLAATIHFLKDNGVKTVMVIGVLPMPPIPLRNYIAQHRLDPVFSSTHRMPFNMTQEDVALDKQVGDIAIAAGALFYSPHDTFCQQNNCLALIGENPMAMTFIDYVHVTPEGAQMLLRPIIDKLH